MKQQHIVPLRGSRRRPYQSALQRLYAALEREVAQRRNDPNWWLREDEKLNRVRLALFGAAPK